MRAVARPDDSSSKMSPARAAASASAGSRARHPMATRSSSATGARTSLTALFTRFPYDVVRRFRAHLADRDAMPLLIVAKNATCRRMNLAGLDRMAEGQPGQGVCREPRASGGTGHVGRAPIPERHRHPLISSCPIAEACSGRGRTWWPAIVDMMIDKPDHFAASGARSGNIKAYRRH